MRLNAVSRPRRRLVSLTPLIDVVFILLLFFMLASNFQQWRMLSLNAPGQTASKPSDHPALSLQIHTDGRLNLAGQELSLSQLTIALQPYLSRYPEQVVVLRPMAEVDLQTLVTVLDTLTQAKVQHLTLANPVP